MARKNDAPEWAKKADLTLLNLLREGYITMANEGSKGCQLDISRLKPARHFVGTPDLREQAIDSMFSIINKGSESGGIGIDPDYKAVWIRTSCIIITSAERANQLKNNLAELGFDLEQARGAPRRAR